MNESGVPLDVKIGRIAVYRGGTAAVAGQFAHITGQIVFPASEQISGEFPELPEFAVRGTLCGL